MPATSRGLTLSGAEQCLLSTETSRERAAAAGRVRGTVHLSRQRNPEMPVLLCPLALRSRWSAREQRAPPAPSGRIMRPEVAGNFGKNPCFRCIWVPITVWKVHRPRERAWAWTSLAERREGARVSYSVSMVCTSSFAATRTWRQRAQGPPGLMRPRPHACHYGPGTSPADWGAANLKRVDPQHCSAGLPA